MTRTHRRIVLRAGIIGALVAATALGGTPAVGRAADSAARLGRYQLRLDEARNLLSAARSAQSQPLPTSTARCHDWIVVEVREQLVVSAVCAVRGGERLELRRVEPQGFNPANLLLELVVFRSPFPPGPATQAVRVFHSEADAGFTSVTILPDGPTLPVTGLEAA